MSSARANPAVEERNNDRLHGGNVVAPSAQLDTSSLHPVSLLDQVLEDVERQSFDSLDKKIDYILQATDFLCAPSGSNQNTSILDGALAILDSSNATIRHVQCSRRSLYLIRASGDASYYYCNSGFCSCRSYLERKKLDSQGICKHLVALKLMPHLGIECPKELVNDEDFATIVYRRVFDVDDN